MFHEILLLNLDPRCFLLLMVMANFSAVHFVDQGSLVKNLHVKLIESQGYSW